MHMTCIIDDESLVEAFWLNGELFNFSTGIISTVIHPLNEDELLRIYFIFFGILNHFPVHPSVYVCFPTVYQSQRCRNTAWTTLTQPARTFVNKLRQAEQCTTLLRQIACRYDLLS
jgi:hypothetical protein